MLSLEPVVCGKQASRKQGCQRATEVSALWWEGSRLCPSPLCHQGLAQSNLEWMRQWMKVTRFGIIGTKVVTREWKPALSEPTWWHLQSLLYVCCFLDTVGNMSPCTSCLGMHQTFATLNFSLCTTFWNISEQGLVIKERTIWELFQKMILLMLESENVK